MRATSWAATARLAWRGARHDCKRTAFVMALIAIPVAAAVVVGAVVEVTTPDPTAQTVAQMGQADLVVETYRGGPADDAPGAAPAVEVSLEEVLADPDVAAEVSSATSLQTATIEQRWVAEDGVTFDLTDLVAYDPPAPLASGMLALAAGDWPEPGEVAITERLADLNDVAIGEEFRVDADAPPAAVVGLLAHPTRLDALTVLAAPGHLDQVVPPDAFVTDALLLASDDPDAVATAVSVVGEQTRGDAAEVVPPALRDALEAVGVSADTIDRLTQPEVDALVADLPTIGPDDLAMQAEMAWDPPAQVTTRQDSLASWPRVPLESPASIGTLVAAALLAEVALIAGAAYAAGIRRRLREVGLLSAQGADTGQIRRVVVGEAVVAGMLGAAIGGLVGVAAVIAGSDLIETFTKVPVIGVPVGPAAVLSPALVGVVAATVAAWLPGRTASRVPTLTALQGRMPESAPRPWIAPVGVAMAVVGAALVVVGRDSGSGTAVAVAGGGVVLVIAGAALLAGPLVALVGLVANRLPPTARLVVRDAARQRTRAAAAVAASMVVLVGPVVAAAAIQQEQATTALLGLPPDGRQVVLETYGATALGNEAPLAMPTEVVDEISALLPGSRRALLRTYAAMVEASDRDDPDSTGLSTGGWMVALATDELVSAIDDDEVAELVAVGTPVLLGTQRRARTVDVAQVWFDEPPGVAPGDGSDVTPVEVVEVPVSVGRGLPRLLLDQATIARLGLAATAEPAMLVVAAEPLTASQARGVRTVAFAWDGETGVDAGVVDPSSIGPVEVLAIVAAATLVVMLLVVGMVTALAAAESRQELRLVTAVGAAPGMRRRFLGLQTWLHVVLGALLAVPLGVLLYEVSTGAGTQVFRSLFGTYDATRVDVPWLAAAALVVGLPLLLGATTAAVVRSSPTKPPRRIA